MFQNRTLNIVFYSFALAAIVALLWWLMRDPTSGFTESLPGLDKRGVADTVSENVQIGKIFETNNLTYTEMSESWSRFRGDDYDNISKSTVRLKEKFGPKGPDIRWSVPLIPIINAFFPPVVSSSG